jgi:hypothetical protein
VEIHGFQRHGELFLGHFDFIEAVVAPANGALTLFAVYGLVDPLGLGAGEAEETLAGFAIVSNVLEIKLRLAYDTLQCLNSLHNKILNFLSSCQIQRCVSPRILNVNVHTSG